MQMNADILSIAMKQTPMVDDMRVLQQKELAVPGTVNYSIRRLRRPGGAPLEDTGMLIYQVEKSQSENSYLELRFCISGNVYCREKQSECDSCHLNKSRHCGERVETVDLFLFRFSPAHLSQFIHPARGGATAAMDDILRFRNTQSHSKMLPLCSRSRVVLESILSTSYTGSLENIFINAQTQMLLLYSLDCMLGEKEINSIQCKFLANEADREKIQKAREILIEQIGDPITIKELSRKVAMNECYLKKGFKEMFGSTIFDFYQSQRMEHAKYLLYEKGLSVTEVSALLGYSSISHFSTAFKKHTGLKPCELLFRG
ncbi:MAG: helix-turn-helix domain-containing protein [Chitinophagaceae bacterium]